MGAGCWSGAQWVRLAGAIFEIPYKANLSLVLFSPLAVLYVLGLYLFTLPL